MKKQMSNILVLTLVLSFFALDLFGQDFTNNVTPAAGKGYYTGTAGTLRMKSDNGKFNGSDPYGRQTQVIPGTVEWTAACLTTPTMPVGGYNNGTLQPTYYTNLATSGSDPKVFGSDVYISGTYTPAGGTRTYTGVTVTFNGANPQSIPGENLTNGTGYTTLVLTGGGAKDLATGQIATVSTVYTQSGSAFTNNGTITLGSGAATSDSSITNSLTGVFNGGTGSLTLTGANATISNAGTFTLNAAGTAAFTTSSLVDNTGTFTLGGGLATTTGYIANTGGGIWNFGAGAFSNTQTFTNNTSGVGGAGVFLGTSDGIATLNNFANAGGLFDAVGGTTINMNGSFTQGGGTITFACDANFNYTGAAQAILKNSLVAPIFASYGNLTLGGTGAKTAGGDVNVCNNLFVNQETDFAPTGNNYTLSMLNTNGPTTPAAATYTGGVEVRGNMRWFRLDNVTTFTYNNANTTLKFSTAPAVGEFVALDVRQNTPPTQYNNPNNPATEVNRRILASYTGTTGVISDIKIGWEVGDETGTSYNAADNTLMRFAEGYSSSQPHQTLVRQGNTYNRASVNATPRFLSYVNGGINNGIALNGAASGGNTRELSNNSEIILTQAPMDVISVQNGRWSDPLTWDIGMMPSATDNVHVRNVVFTGIETQVFGATRAWTDNEINGRADNTDAGASANRIYIDDVANSALVIGNTDADMAGSGVEHLFRTRMVNGASTFIQNNNTNANTGDGNSDLAAGLNGIWVRPQKTSPSALFVPVMGTYQLNNLGNIQNNSIIEVGICN